MKFWKWVLAVLACTALLFAGCANDSGEDDDVVLPEAPAEIADGYIRVNYKGSGSKYCLWIWGDFSADAIASYGSSWPNGAPFTYSKDGFICTDLKLADSPSSISMLVYNTSNASQSKDIVFSFPARYNEIFLFPDDEAAYISADKGLPKGVSAAMFTSDTVIAVSGADVTLSATTVKVTDKNGTAVSVANYDSEKMMVTLTASIKAAYSTSAPYTFEVTDGGTTDKVTVSLDPALLDTWFGTAAATEAKAGSKKLGVTPNGATASFKMWAPLATSVNLLLYKDSASLNTVAKTVEMTAGNNGFWTADDVALDGSTYYQYEVENNGSKNKVSDIWSYVASADSVASQIATVDDVAAIPAGWEEEYTNPWSSDDYRDAVIYEMHIRDWSRADVSDSTGKFLDIANSTKIIEHLKDLGVTHVQILPMFDYAQTNANENYNWGYNPYHYNVPEGRYVTKAYADGTQAVKEMRMMIQKLHEEGIAVIMDVVYNHTNGTGSGSLYDMTVPQYFYRMNGSAYSNGSGCGNEVATNHAMVKYYVIESLKHWMNDYHINGFRFDLMGLHEQSTMKEIYEELSKIDRSVMVYGEPWTGGTAAVVNGMTGAVLVSGATGSNGVGAFDDDFRDAIKGGEFGGFKIGQVQESWSDAGIETGLLGKSGGNNRNNTGKPGLALHYVECHDNYTLYDKLAYSANSAAGVTGIIGGDSIVSKFLLNPTAAQLETIRKQDKLAAAYIFLAQGTPFINGGQEFLRTKKGNPDSYSADTKGGVTWTNTPGQYNIDDCNTIDLAFKTTYSDVYNTYKALIKIRKDFDAFRKGSYVTATNAGEKGVTKYETDGSDGKTYQVYFNATSADYTLSKAVEGFKFTISETDGTYSVASEATAISVIPAKGFIILRKK